jgi:hypothetical protein
MAGLTWLDSNWFSLVQTVGIVGGLIFTASTIRENSKERRMSNMLTLSDRHRALWNEAVQRKELDRVFQPDADLKNPTTITEEEFLNLAMIHYELGWRLAKSIGRDEARAQERDACNFFSLPLPRAFWEKSKGFRNQRFVRYVGRVMK